MINLSLNWKIMRGSRNPHQASESWKSAGASGWSIVTSSLKVRGSIPVLMRVDFFFLNLPNFCADLVVPGHLSCARERRNLNMHVKDSTVHFNIRSVTEPWISPKDRVWVPKTAMWETKNRRTAKRPVEDKTVVHWEHQSTEEEENCKQQSVINDRGRNIGGRVQKEFIQTTTNKTHTQNKKRKKKKRKKKERKKETIIKETINGWGGVYRCRAVE